MDQYNTFEDFNTPIVIDNGSGSIKAGIAGRERPSAVIPSVIGIPKHRRVMLQAERKKKYFFSSQDMDNGGLCRLIYPICNGVISTSKRMEHMTSLWDYVYKELINSPMQDHPVLLTEAVHNPIRNRVDTARIFFEQFNVPALYFAPPPVLSLYASGRLTGCVLDCGEGLSSVVPICEGFAIPHAIERIDIGGAEITNYFSFLLKRSGCKLNRSSSEKEIVRKIKENLCELQVIGRGGSSGIGIGIGGSGHTGYSSQNKKPKGIFGDEEAEKNNSLFYQYIDEDLQLNDGHNIGVSSSSSSAQSNAPKYKLPDGTELSVGSARYRAPEILFNPSMIGAEYGGIQDCIYNCINKCDLDLRKDLYKTIVLSGGSTNIKNFGRRLVTEIQLKVPKAKIKVYAPLERHLTAWIGGSLLSSLEGFRPMWITAKEFSEFGNSILFRKSFF
eukprot:1160258_1